MPSAKDRFLDYYKTSKSKGTHKSYRRSLDLFEEYYGKNLDTILAERKTDVTSEDFERTKRFDREIEKFHKWMLERGYSINSARGNTIGIMQFFKFYGMPVNPQAFPTHLTTKTYIPPIEELRRLFNVADLRARTILSLGLDLAWRVSDFSPLKKSDIPDLNQSTPIPLEKITQKESVISSTFISRESAELLKAYVPTLPKENSYLLPSGSNNHLDDESINKILKKLCLKAKLKIPENKRFTFHSLRKRFLSTCYNLGINPDIAKLLVGKSIGKSMETYLGDVKLKSAFIEVREQALSLSNGTVKTEIQMKDEEIVKLNKRIEQLELTLRGMMEIYGEELYKKALAKLGLAGRPKHPDEELDPTEALIEVGKRSRRKHEKEYKEMLDETNGFNHNH